MGNECYIGDSADFLRNSVEFEVEFVRKTVGLLLKFGVCTDRGVVLLCERPWSGLRTALVASWLECATGIGDFL